MKRINLLISVVVLLFLCYSCGGEQEETCMNCRQVTYDKAGNILNETNSNQFCGQNLTDIENESPIVTDSTETKWVCEL
ncbi:MAG: hypothetical protein K9J13_02840 [Saprospiraceae bacterium]|nr:hypothetical protein [Saprospiraceae bacterium]